jgi:hypothetical protein
MRLVSSTLGVALLSSLLLNAPAGGASAAPAGGTIKLFATLSSSDTTGPILITGAIGDAGTYLNIDKNGKVDANGNYVKLTLKKGTFEVDDTALNKAGNSLQPSLNSVTCSASVSISAPITLFNGTGRYAGIAGTIHVTETVAFILPTYTSGAKKGQCNESNNAQPSAQFGVILGSGTVHFQ